MNIFTKSTTGNTGPFITKSSNKRLGAAKWALLLTSLCTTSFTFATDFKEIAKELEIMDSVLSTSLKQENKDQSIQFRSLTAQYLAKQGVVFEIATSQSVTRFRAFFDGNSAPSSPPESPAFPAVLSRSESRLLGEQQVAIARGLEEKQMLASENSSNRIREVQQTMRDTEWQLRDYQRQLRDLNFELRSASEERKKEIKEMTKALEKKAKEFTQQQKELNANANKLKLEMQKKLEEQQKNEIAASKLFLSAFEQDIADNLCRFGGGLRALPEDENVSFVLSNFNASTNWESKDRIYVFPLKEIKRCVQDKIKVKELLAKATVYDF
ncbi:hypothetical protein [Glaciecola petra]|uniref:Uncharacterized protein n=1 Tax=Glaciecola petra TaxID=3075602 RepID=A0ABU2ZV73_9ALTE|nr:hypothetical protein [Aestuariibacter sp. P117]MDT0596300.1 hypothetical protein [Aestuariibacter sp. P117]